MKQRYIVWIIMFVCDPDQVIFIGRNLEQQ